jgi:hypothetical protein
MSKKSDDREFSRLMYRAYLTDKDGNVHTGEALLLACLLHAKGASRKSKDMEDVQKIMKDINARSEKAKK